MSSETTTNRLRDLLLLGLLGLAKPMPFGCPYV
uniref:Uncharacterized protein n=1 Tax=Setaria italica TaxID=4555 RepID=K3XU41_SETIT